MAIEQANTNEAIAQAVAEATRVKIQAMAVARAQSTQNVGPKLGRHSRKQLAFNWSFTDKYAQQINFKLEVKYVSQL